MLTVLRRPCATASAPPRRHFAIYAGETFDDPRTPISPRIRVCGGRGSRSGGARGRRATDQTEQARPDQNAPRLGARATAQGGRGPLHDHHRDDRGRPPGHHRRDERWTRHAAARPRRRARPRPHPGPHRPRRGGAGHRRARDLRAAPLVRGPLRARRRPRRVLPPAAGPGAPGRHRRDRVDGQRRRAARRRTQRGDAARAGVGDRPAAGQAARPRCAPSTGRP